MFKCWKYVAGENLSSVNSGEYLSDKEEIYSKVNKQEAAVIDKESTFIESYFPGRKLEFLNRFINFS